MHPSEPAPRKRREGEEEFGVDGWALASFDTELGVAFAYAGQEDD